MANENNFQIGDVVTIRGGGHKITCTEVNAGQEKSSYTLDSPNVSCTFELPNNVLPEDLSRERSYYLRISNMDGDQCSCILVHKDNAQTLSFFDLPTEVIQPRILT